MAVSRATPLKTSCKKGLAERHLEARDASQRFNQQVMKWVSCIETNGALLPH
jgi:hypothetical protein